MTHKGKTYPYLLETKRVKNVKLTVDKDKNIVVSAPSYISTHKIEDFITENIAFIEKNITRRNEIERLHNLKEYKTGEYFLLFGDRIKIVSKKLSQDKVVLEDKLLYILLAEDTKENRKAHFEKFLKDLGKQVFGELLDENYPAFQKKIKVKPHITVRQMTTKWGSANPAKNKITLNTALLFAPKELIEYVLIHELCHFYHLDHSKAFYKKLAESVPDYKEKRKRLKETYGFMI
ncbi:MAG: SprT family zinc-dependent metalloprotease [Eubacteriales bacterium]